MGKIEARELVDEVLNRASNLSKNLRYPTAVAAGLTLANNALGSYVSSHDKKNRVEARAVLVRHGIPYPTEEQIDSYLIHKAGRRKPEEYNEDKYLMPTTKGKAVAGGIGAGLNLGALAGIGAGAALAKKSSSKFSVNRDVEMLLDLIGKKGPSGAALGALAGSVVGGSLAGSGYDKLKSAMDKKRERDRNRDRVSESVKSNAEELVNSLIKAGLVSIKRKKQVLSKIEKSLDGKKILNTDLNSM